MKVTESDVKVAIISGAVLAIAILVIRVTTKGIETK